MKHWRLMVTLLCASCSGVLKELNAVDGGLASDGARQSVGSAGRVDRAASPADLGLGDQRASDQRASDQRVVDQRPLDQGVTDRGVIDQRQQGDQTRDATSDAPCVQGQEGCRWDSAAPPACGNQILIATAGQSNMVGQGDANQAPTPDQNKAFQYLWQSDQIVGAKEPVGENYGVLFQANSGSMASSFLHRYVELTGNRITLAHTGTNGAGLYYDSGWGHFQPGGNVLSSSIGKINAAKLKTGLPLTLIVYLGAENDVWVAHNETRFVKAQFKQGVRAMLDAYRAQTEVKHFGFVLPGHINCAQSDQAALQDVRAGIVEVSQESPYADWVHILDTQTETFHQQGLMQGDCVHISQAGLNRAGKAAAERFVADVCGR